MIDQISVLPVSRLDRFLPLGGQDQELGNEFLCLAGDVQQVWLMLVFVLTPDPDRDGGELAI
ncbi:MAG: hypothetical protein MH204_00655, partial [Fimbriimonadaceae bacterium]|nr:hypothetical protein [Fimbriimonadaceae bacterium]